MKTTRRWISLVLSMALLLSLMPVNAEAITDITYGVTGGFLYFNPETGEITDCDETVIEAIVPSEINGVPVTSIATGSFYNCNDLLSVTLSSNITYIGPEAFAGCDALATIVLPESIEQIGFRAFYNCFSLESVILPEGMLWLDTGLFQACTSLTKVSIPKSITTISAGAFRYCNNLTTVFYSGTQEQWNAIEIADYNEPLSNSTVYCIDGTINENEASSDSNKISVGDHITFGSKNGESVSWEVLEIDGTTALLFSDYVLDFIEYGLVGSYSYESAFASWCSNFFLGDVFSESEKEAVINTSVDGLPDQQLFFFSKDEYGYYFPNGNTGYRTLFPGVNGVIGAYGLGTIDASNDNLTYWLRSTTGDQWVDLAGFSEGAYFTGTSASINLYRSSYGACPALYIDILKWDGQIIKDELPDEQEEIQVDTDPYYKVPENRLFYIHAIGSEYPSGFSVNIDGVQYTSGASNPYWSDAITVTIPADYCGDINIIHENDEYYPFDFSANLTGQTNTITMIPRTVTGPFPHALLQVESGETNRSHPNLLADVQYFNEVTLQDKANPETIQLYPLINWNGHGEGAVWLEQGNITISLKPNELNELDWSQCYFAGGKPIYLCVSGEDNMMTRTKTAISVYEKPGADVKLNLGDSLTFDTGDAENEEISILEKQELSLEFPGDIDNIEISVQGDGTVQGVIGFTFGEISHKESAFASTEKQRFRDVFKETVEVVKRLADPTQDDDLKGVTDYINRLNKQGVKPAYSHGSFGVKGSVQIVGYLTGKITSEGVDITELEAAVIVSGSVSYTHNTIVVVAAVPIAGHYKITLGAKIGAYISCKRDEILNEFVPVKNYELKGNVSLNGELGPGWIGYASCGVKGDGKLKIKSVIPIIKEETILSLQGDLSLVGTLLGINGEWTFFKSAETVFWNAGEWCWVDVSDISMDMNLLSEESSDITPPTFFTPNLERTIMLFSGENDHIASGINGYQAPALARLSDGNLLAVWVADVESRNAVDKNGIYYSICSDGVWDTPSLVCNDGTNDSLPQIHNDNGEICIAWQNYSTAFGTDELPDYDTLSAQIKTASMVFNEDEAVWEKYVEGQPEWYLTETDLPEDYEGEWPTTTSNRQVLEDSNMRAVLYTAIDSSGINHVWGIFNDGVSWGEPVQLTTGLNAVNWFSAIKDNNKLTILYTRGEQSDATLDLCEVYNETDIVLNNADYLHQTFSPGQKLTLKLSITNNSITTVNGVTVTVLTGNEAVHQEDIAVRFDSGEEDTLYVNYTLPHLIDFDHLNIHISPIGTTDIDNNNNYAECVFCATDLSVEHISAIDNGEFTQVLTQVINRGQITTEGTTIIYRKNASDGEVVDIQELKALEVGELVNIKTKLHGVAADDMLYVEIIQSQEENLISNNTLHTVISGCEIKSTSDSTGIIYTEFSDGNIKATITCAPDAHNTALIAAYDANGRMLEVYSFNLESGMNTIIESINADNVVSVRVFLLDENYTPIGIQATEIDKTGFRLVLAEALTSLTYSRDESSLDIFKDAEKIEAECADAVLRMFNLGLMPDDSGVINPESAITRAELAQMIYIALNGGVDDGAVAYADEDIFSDVKADDWYAGYANYCASQDVVPITADYFNATNPVTTADAARMLLCAMGYSAETCGFVGDNWSNNVLAASEAVGLLDGFNYSTNTYIPRQWLAVIFCNAIDNA